MSSQRWLFGASPRCRLVAPCYLTAIVFVITSCASDVAPGVPEHRINDVSVIVATESEKLARPIDMVFDEDGLLWVLDYLAAQVLVLSPDGEPVRTIGRDGSGPREFKLPSAFALSQDTLRVVDGGNGRVQTLARGSDFTRTAPLTYESAMGPIAVRSDGRYITTTLGLNARSTPM